MDILKKVLIDDGNVQVVALDATQLVQQSMVQAEAWPPATIHMGQGLLAALALLSIFTKDTDGKLSLQWSSNGPFGDLYVEANPSGNVRGTILKPQAAVQNLYSSMGPGNLMVRKTFHNSSNGVVSSKGDVCLDVLNYLSQSEQRQCAMNLWVDLSWNDKNPDVPVSVEAAYGYLLECLPDPDPRRKTLKTQIWEDRLTEMGTLSKWKIDRSKPVDSIIEHISDGSGSRELMTQNIRFHCNCTEERAERALALAVRESGEPQVEAEIIRCEFCGKKYEISPQSH